MSLTQTQLVALKTEITTDPLALGYAGKSDAEIADLLNLPRATITIRRANIAPNEVLEAIDSRDFDAAPNAIHVAWFESITQLRTIRLENDDGSATRALGNLRRLLQAADTQGSRTRLAALATRIGSRAEQLLGGGVTVTHIDVADARNS